MKANDNKEKQVKTKKLAWLNRLSTVFKIEFLSFGNSYRTYGSIKRLIEETRGINIRFKS